MLSFPNWQLAYRSSYYFLWQRPCPTIRALLPFQFEHCNAALYRMKRDMHFCSRKKLCWACCATFKAACSARRIDADGLRLLSAQTASMSGGQQLPANSRWTVKCISMSRHTEQPAGNSRFDGKLTSSAPLCSAFPALRYSCPEESSRCGVPDGRRSVHRGFPVCAGPCRWA